MPFVTRHYNQIVLNKFKGTVTKSSKETRLADEINFYKNLPDEIKIFFPRLVSSKTDLKLFEMELEYYPYKNLGMIGDSIGDWTILSDSFNYLFNLFTNVKYSNFSKDQIKKYKFDMYFGKTEKEYYALKNKFEFFNKFCSEKEVNINGIKYKNFEVVWPLLKPFIEKNYCTDEPFSFMHGDFCFSNILSIFDSLDNPVIKLIDPRGSFGVPGTHGDFYYDLAKLMHSASGNYEKIIYDLFRVESKDNRIDYSFNSINKNALSVLNDKVFNKFDMLKIKMIEGMIWIGMVARHGDSLDRQKIMMAQGIKILNECLEKIK